jgi:hypothetical protein
MIAKIIIRRQHRFLNSLGINKTIGDIFFFQFKFRLPVFDTIKDLFLFLKYFSRFDQTSGFGPYNQENQRNNNDNVKSKPEDGIPGICCRKIYTIEQK